MFKPVKLAIVGFILGACAVVVEASLPSARRVATAQIPTEFQYGCGTGCRIRAKLVGNVQTVRLSSGNQLRRGAFQVTGGMNRGGRNSSAPRLSYIFAACPTRSIGWSEKRDQLPDSNAWMVLRGTQWDYTTVAAGRGYYFDVLCRRS